MVHLARERDGIDRARQRATLSTIRLAALLAILFYAQLCPVAEGGPSKESKHVAKYGVMPFYDRYLYPGGGVAMSVGCLSRPEERVMALTFDDGPDDKDLKISAILKKEAIPATFFYVGSKTKGTSAIVNGVVADNHVVGYHAYRHRMLSWYSPASLAEDFRLGKESMEGLGVSPTWFRPPYGDFNGTV
ncbi:MAG: polysaccharide deacetylase family protein, partial [Magnetococcus sp. YQC-3]